MAYRTLASVLMLVLCARVAAAQTTGPVHPIKAVGLFSVLGETLEVSTTSEPAASRLDRTLRQTLTVRGIGFDRAVAGAVKRQFSRSMPTVHLRMFGASGEMASAQQRELALNANHGGLPGWILDSVREHRLSHVLLVTRDRVEGNIETASAETIGRVDLEGIGLHVDMYYKVRNVETRVEALGALAPHVVVRLTLFDVEAARVARSILISEQRLVAPREGRTADGPWGFLTQEEKVRALHGLLERGLERNLPRLLEGL